MQLIQEISDKRMKVLIIAEKNTYFLQLLVDSLKKSNADISIVIQAPAGYDEYDLYFFINTPNVLLPEFADRPEKRFICILFNQDSIAQTLSSFAYEHNLTHIKIINLQTSKVHYQKDIDTILWFSFSRNEDIFLHLYHADLEDYPNKIKKEKKPFKIDLSFFKKPKSLLIIGVLIILLSNFMFIPPLLLGTYYTYKEAQQMMNDPKYEPSTAAASHTLDTASKLYSYSGPTLRLFSIARPFENLFEINTSSLQLLSTVKSLEKDSSRLTKLITTKNKSQFEIEELLDVKKRVFANIRTTYDHIVILDQKLPDKYTQLEKAKSSITFYKNTLPLVIQMEPFIDTFFAKNDEKKYLLLFANNMELRPGGGFIGSFAILKVKNYEITELQVYDVYDADGQLTEHLEPPKPISEILQQPFWFVRDSAFTPDFITNFKEAEILLEKEIGEKNFDGGMLFTTTAVQNLLEASKGLYIPDYDETITSDNFYLKAQLYAEKDFFPGSIQKKRLLSSVMNQLLLNVGDISTPELVEQLQQSLNEKQLVLYSKDSSLQEFLEKNYWSGRTLKPQCTLKQAINCILDYTFPLDANLGVNKANFFIQRPVKMSVVIQDDGKITNTMRLSYTNNSYPDIFPGGTYKNYFQLLVPPNSSINKITVDEEQITEYDETNLEYRSVGFLLEIPPQSSKIVEITYTLPTTIIKGKGMYQLIFQKQIGSANDSLELEIEIPKNFSIINNNFSPLVKGNKINYNTSISSDKIFLIEFSKQ